MRVCEWRVVVVVGERKGKRIRKRDERENRINDRSGKQELQGKSHGEIIMIQNQGAEMAYAE